MYKIGVDIGGTKINVGLFSNRTLLVNKKLYLSETSDMVNSILEAVRELCKQAGISFGQMVSCGAGIPGTVSADGKTILKAPNNSKFCENFTEKLEEALQVPVTLVQDSRAAAWGEYLCGGGVDARTVVCVTLGTGIGTGIVIDGRIYNGALGCAGELGHLPARKDGRACGCGKYGCVEKYSAGLGLDLTAEELLGKGFTSKDLFRAAENGNPKAGEAITEAVEMLGNALVSVVNLLSPDVLLFSGGLSEQEEQLLNPLITYIKENCYNAGQLPVMKKAVLGENAPLYGAAMIPGEEKRNPQLSVSIMCADVLNLGTALEEIEKAGITYIHCDIMDNHFVPNLMLPPELLNKLRRKTGLPFDFHIMAEAPESIMEKLDIRKDDIVSIHYESTIHLQRVITLIREKGAKVSIALNPSTPITVLEEVLPEMDMVLLMSVNPGFSGQKIVPSSFDKITKMKKLLLERKLENIRIEVDGNCSFENVPRMYHCGADIFVVGTSSVFQGGLSIWQGTQKLMELFE